MYRSSALNTRNGQYTLRTPSDKFVESKKAQEFKKLIFNDFLTFLLRYHPAALILFDAAKIR